MATPERAMADGHLLDETDVDRAIADETAVGEEPVSEALRPSESALTEEDVPTTEDLEQELEDGTPGPEEEALHREDAVTEVLDDEQQAEKGDLEGEVGEELEWRMAAKRDENNTPAPLAGPGDAPTEAAETEPGDAVRALMSTPVAWVEPSVSLVDLAVTLETEAVGAIAILSGDHLDGVASERDVVPALAAGGDPADVWAGDVMADEPLSVAPDEAIITVVERMLDEGVRHVPVVSDGHVVGVVSARDGPCVLADAWRRTGTNTQQEGA